MLRYIAARILSLIPVLFVVAVVIFSLIYLTPGDPARVLLGDTASEEQVLALRISMGLDKPIVVQFFAWVGQALVGDLGDSIFLRQSVTDAIASHLKPTAWLGSLALIVALCIAIPMGTLAARFRGSWLDRFVAGFTLMGMAVPSFVLALLLILIFAVGWRLFPVAGYVDPGIDFFKGMRTLILPAFALGSIMAALLTRTTRAAVLDVRNSDYVEAARSRGVSETKLLFAHTLKNAGLPVLTVVGLSFGVLITGSAVTETIFNIPGLGSLVINAISRRDYPVIQGVVLFVTVVYLLINLIVDLLYGVIDPRVRLGRSK